MLNHPWDITPRKAIELQRELAAAVSEAPIIGPVRTVAGVDCAFLAEGKAWANRRRDVRIIAGAVLCDAASMEVVASAHVVRDCGFPYVPGLLSFREAPAVIAAVNRLPCRPDLLMCDGQGLAHPRGLGLASHVGLWLEIPTIGVAKSRLCGEHRMPGRNRGCRTQLRHEGAVVGTVLRTRTDVKPLYISVGHRVSLADAVGWTLRCCRGVRLPEPTRRAHRYVSRLRGN